MLGVGHHVSQDVGGEDKEVGGQGAPLFHGASQLEVWSDGAVYFDGG